MCFSVRRQECPGSSWCLWHPPDSSRGEWGLSSECLRREPGEAFPWPSPARLLSLIPVLWPGLGYQPALQPRCGGWVRPALSQPCELGAKEGRFPPKDTQTVFTKRGAVLTSWTETHAHSCHSLLQIMWPWNSRGLLWRLSGKESTCQRRRCGFDLWVQKIPWRRKWQPTRLFLPGEFHRQRSLAGYSP